LEWQAQVSGMVTGKNIGKTPINLYDKAGSSIIFLVFSGDLF
jgi:hypothetical protein